MLSGLCALDVAIDRVLNGRYDKELGRIWEKTVPPGSWLLRFSPRLLRKGRYVYYKNGSQWQLAQCVNYDSASKNAQLTFSHDNSKTQTVAIDARNCKICMTLDSLPCELNKSPKEATPSFRPPNTFLYGYKTVLTGATTFTDIKRFFRNNADDLTRSNVYWRVFFERKIPGMIFRSARGAHKITSSRIEGMPGQRFDEQSRPSHPDGRQMKFRAGLRCSQLQLNLYIVLHHWACFDSEKPGADDAVALSSECGNGFDRSFAAVDVNADIIPEMFTIQRCILDWLNALVSWGISTYDCLEDRCTVRPSSFDACIVRILSFLKTEISHIFIMLNHPLNPVFTGLDSRIDAQEIEPRKVRSETIVLKALMACFDVKEATKESIYDLAAESFRRHLEWFLGQAVLVRCDKLRCRDFQFDSFYNNNIELLEGLKPGDIVDAARIRQKFNLIRMKLFSDLQKGDLIVLGDRWMLVEFKRFDINCDPLQNVQPRNEEDEEGPRLFAIQTRRAVVHDGKTEILIRNIESIFILKPKERSNSQSPAWQNAFKTNFTCYTIGLRGCVVSVNDGQYHVLRSIEYLKFTLFILMKAWLETKPTLGPDLTLPSEIKQKVDQLVFMWIMMVTGACSSEPIKYRLDSWAYVPESARANKQDQVVQIANRSLNELWQWCYRAGMNYVTSGQKVDVQKLFQEAVNDSFEFMYGWGDRLEMPQCKYTMVLPWKVCKRTVGHSALTEFVCLQDMVGNTILDANPLANHPYLQPLQVLTRTDVSPGDIILVEAGEGFMVGSFLRFQFNSWNNQTVGSDAADGTLSDFRKRCTEEDVDPNKATSFFDSYRVMHTDLLEIIYSIGTNPNGTPIEQKTSDLRKMYYITACDTDPSEQ